MNRNPCFLRPARETPAADRDAGRGYSVGLLCQEALTPRSSASFAGRTVTEYRMPSPNQPRISDRVSRIPKSAIHEMTRLSQAVEDVAFLSWAKPTSDTPEHIKEAAVAAIREGLVGGYSGNAGLPELREEIVEKLRRDNQIEANASQIMVTVGAIEGLAAAVMAVVDPGDLRPPTQHTSGRLSSPLEPPFSYPQSKSRDSRSTSIVFVTRLLPRPRPSYSARPTTPRVRWLPNSSFANWPT